jgi:hypothetical protein
MHDGAQPLHQKTEPAAEEVGEEGEVSRKEDFVDLRPQSLRGIDWVEFSGQVLNHIEVYTVPQYGDKGEDQATEYTVEDHIKQAQKYLSRFGRNSRPGQEMLDFRKAAHYIQMAATTFKEESTNGAA